METTNEYNQKEYEAYKEHLKTLIDMIKENNELNYNTEIYFVRRIITHTNFFLKIGEDR